MTIPIVIMARCCCHNPCHCYHLKGKYTSSLNFANAPAVAVVTGVSQLWLPLCLHTHAVGVVTAVVWLVIWAQCWQFWWCNCYCKIFRLNIVCWPVIYACFTYIYYLTLTPAVLVCRNHHITISCIWHLLSFIGLCFWGSSLRTQVAGHW